jgi:integrase
MPLSLELRHLDPLCGNQLPEQLAGLDSPDKDAKAWSAELQPLRREASNNPKALTVQDLVDRFLAYQAKQHPRSLESYYRPLCLSFTRWCGENRPLDGLSLSDFQLFHADRTAATSAATANRSMQVVKSMFRLAEDWGLVLKSPAAKVKKHPESRGMDRFLSVAEQERLLAACQGPFRGLVLVALRTGMRRGELLRLRPRDVDFSRGLLTLTKTKTNAPRHLTLLPEIKELLWGIAGSIPEDGLFFRSRKGLPYAPSGVASNFKRAVKKAGLREVRFHDLRHTHASDLLAARVELPVIQKILGHASIKTTQRYAHLDNDRDRQAMEALGGYLSRQSRLCSMIRM